MPNIISKRPESAIKFEYVSSKNISDLTKELNLTLITVSIGRGFYMLVQYNNEFDNFNINFDNIPYYGQLFVIKATKSKIIDIEKDDLNFLESIII